MPLSCLQLRRRDGWYVDQGLPDLLNLKELLDLVRSLIIGSIADLLKGDLLMLWVVVLSLYPHAI